MKHSNRPRPGQEQESGRPRAVLFSCRADTARAVFLAGTFNAWEPEATPMRRNAKGLWTARLPLAPGRYEYKFVVDGRWCCEPGREDDATHSSDTVPNAFGTLNRVIEVK